MRTGIQLYYYSALQDLLVTTQRLQQQEFINSGKEITPDHQPHNTNPLWNYSHFDFTNLINGFFLLQSHYKSFAFYATGNFFRNSGNDTKAHYFDAFDLFKETLFSFYP